MEEKTLFESILKENSLAEAMIKNYEDVEVGDIGEDYGGNKVVILDKGPASKFNYADGFEEFVDLGDYDPDDADFNDQIDAEWPECVLVQFTDDESEVVYTYGSDGVIVYEKKLKNF